MKVKQKISLILAMLFALSMFLVGCSNSSSTSASKKPASNSQSSSKSNASNTSSNNSTSTSTSTPKAVPLVGGEPNGNYTDNFNPFSTSANGSLYGLIGMLYQPMYIFSTVSHKQYPELATKYQWINSNKTLEVTLRKGVKWSDGQAFSADDVLFTFNTELKQYPAADTSGIMKNVASVVKKSDNVVDFNFDKPNVAMQEYILQEPIVPQHIWKSLGDPSKVTMTKPVGTGPYVLASFSPQVFKYKKNPLFYDAASYKVPEVDMKAFNSNQSAQLALASGQLDWAGMFIPSVDKVFGSKSPNNKYWFPPGAPVMLYPNLKNPLLKDINVRKAINLAIDRQKIVNQAEYGYAKVASPTGVQVPRDNNFIAPEYKNLTLTQNLSKAEQILKSAGYKKGSDGIYVSPSGKKLSFTLQVVSGWSDWVQTCQIISQDLKKIGIAVKVQQPQYGAYQSNLQSGKFDLAISWTNAGTTPYHTFKDMLGSKGGWNVEGWNDPATDKALTDFNSTTDPTQQNAAMKTLESVMVNQLPVFPLFYGPMWYEYTTTHYTGWPTQNNQYDTPAIFNWPQGVEVIHHLQPK